jgi:uncharacterized membrane protein (Fun14 family)
MGEKRKAADVDRHEGMTGGQKLVLVALLLLLVGSVVGRFFLGGGESAVTPGAGPGELGSSFTAGGGAAAAAQAEPTPAEKALPYVTEGSLFALLGFALGYATRKIVKVGLILLALLFVGVQVLAYTGVIQIDWPHAVEAANRLVLNWKENVPAAEVVTRHVPSAGALVAGYLLGFRRG